MIAAAVFLPLGSFIPFSLQQIRSFFSPGVQRVVQLACAEAKVKHMCSPLSLGPEERPDLFTGDHKSKSKSVLIL